MDQRFRGWALAAIGMVLVSFDSVFVRLAQTDAWTFTFVFAVASIAAMGVAVAIAPASQRCPTNWGLLAVGAALAAGTQLAFITAVDRTLIANVVVIVGATPVVAAGVGWFVLRERVRRPVAIAITAATAGIIVIVGTSVGTPTLDGDLLAIAAVVLVSATIALLRRHPELPRTTMLFSSSVLLAVVALPFADLGSLDGRAALAATLAGGLTNPLGRLAYTTAPSSAPVAEVAMFTPVETVAATIWAWWWFNEVPRSSTVAGGSLVLGAVIAVTTFEWRRSRRRTPPLRAG